MSKTISHSAVRNFLGQSPEWYKLSIIAFLILNPILLATVGPFVTGWILILEFIFTLAMALKCYPLQAGGLLAIEAVIMGLTSPYSVFHEVLANFEVILLLIFMVAGIYFMKQLLMFMFTHLLLNVKSKVALSLLFMATSAILSAFLDALTVTAVIISVGVGFYSIYHKVASGKHYHHSHDHSNDDHVEEVHHEDLVGFRKFLRGLLMHALVGTALGGVSTMVGEPQNLLIAEETSWQFMEFVFRMSPITLPVFFAGLITCVLLEKIKILDYGSELPLPVRHILEDYSAHEAEKQTANIKAKLIVQALVGIWLVVALALHLAEVGLIGLSVIILITSFNGIIEEHQLGHAFEEALPFTALLVVFFAVVAVIHDQDLFGPIIQYVLSFEGSTQIGLFYIANGLLSMISDNVFVATVYITEVKDAWVAGQITREQFEMIAVAINTGTNIPSIATPNGQAAFLFLLTSTIAPLIRLSYGKMVLMALPYTLILSTVGFILIYFTLPDMTNVLYDAGLIHQFTGEAADAASSSTH